ncbi:HNH endonuclease signature motif containing protein [Promicromonospora aerolata]|uniref:HNH endonuclease n=1 Tax=Promicromonospora aerolata TaxID=195749 RepID=A0ABW4V3W5_9MICO
MDQDRADERLGGAPWDGAPLDDGGVGLRPPGEPPGPEWPPDVVPVVLWPAELLREALSGAPGLQLARVVAEVADPDADMLGDLPDDVLGELVIACGRLQSWSAGVQARAVGERAARETSPLAHGSLVGQVTGELVVTEREGTEVVVRAEAGAVHPTVITALVAGRIDARKAHTLLRSAAQLTAAERAEAISRYLPQAPRRTWRWLQARMLQFAKARHGAAETVRAEEQRRSVCLDRAENDMGWLTAYLPAVDAAAVWGVVDDMAHQLQRTAGEERNLAQLRADSLTGLVTGRLLPADRFDDACAVSSVGGVAAGGAAAEDTAAERAGSGGAGPVCTCGGRAPVVQEVVRPVRVTPTRPVVRVTVPASALLGLDDAPGDLAGFGPVPAESARLIAQDATWQRLVTDPVTGVLVDYSTRTYQPGKVLRAGVEARDGTCTFVGCARPAAWCDLDHIEPFDHDAPLDHDGTVDEVRADRHGGRRGQTSAQNLHALCRRHHLLKTHGGWRVGRDQGSGVTTWTAPGGRTHVRPPTVLDTRVEIDQIDPDTSYDLTLRALTGRSLRRHRTSETETDTDTDPTGPTGTGPDDPPF